MKIEEIIKQPEGRRLEFKEALPFSYKETHYEQLRTITNKYIKSFNQFNKQELQQELQYWLRQGIEKEKQELQQELKQESLFTLIISKLLDAPKSRKEISIELGQKAISGRLNEVFSQIAPIPIDRMDH